MYLHGTCDSCSLCTSVIHVIPATCIPPRYMWPEYLRRLLFPGWDFLSLRNGHCKVSSSGLSQVDFVSSALLTMRTSVLGATLTNLVRSSAMQSPVSRSSGDHYSRVPHARVHCAQEMSSRFKLKIFPIFSSQYTILSLFLGSHAFPVGIMGWWLNILARYLWC